DDHAGRAEPRVRSSSACARAPSARLLLPVSDDAARKPGSVGKPTVTSRLGIVVADRSRRARPDETVPRGEVPGGRKRRAILRWPFERRRHRRLDGEVEGGDSGPTRRPRSGGTAPSEDKLLERQANT